MRTVLQRVTQAAVTVDSVVVGAIGPGLVAFVSIAAGDGPADIAYTTSKVRDARVFADADGRMNQSVADIGGAVLLVSQFTLHGDLRRGRRPSFGGAADPDTARQMFENLVDSVRATGLPVATGRFQTQMRVDVANDGPVTILLDSRREF